MKYIKQTIMLSCLLFATQSCSDYVEIEASEVYQINASGYFQSQENYEAALVGAYDPLQWLYLNVLIGDIASDNSFCGGESATDVIGLQQIDDMTHYPNNDNLTSVWRWCFEGINRVNYLDENKDLMDFEGKEALYGEAYFLRAYYYFELVKFFGGVPVFTTRISAADTGSLQRASVEEVYAFIESDLLSAINALPHSQNQSGRATKGAAQALLGKVYLFQDKFTDAASMLQNVIGLYSLVTDYESQFLKAGENGPESVFEIQYSNESEWWDWGFNPQGTEGNFGVIHNGPRAYSGPNYASGWSFNVPTPDLFNSFEDGDTRREASILDIEAWAAETGASYATGYEHTGYFNKKYIPRAGESGAQTELNYLNNYRAIRYADVLLMAAEANARGGINEDLARNYLNQVRQRAFGDTDHNISTSGQALVNAIWAERNLELSMEGHRFFDLVRTGQAGSVIDGFVSGKNELFPIPQLAVDIEGLSQNPQY